MWKERELNRNRTMLYVCPDCYRVYICIIFWFQANNNQTTVKYKIIHNKDWKNEIAMTLLTYIIIPQHSNITGKVVRYTHCSKTKIIYK